MDNFYTEYPDVTTYILSGLLAVVCWLSIQSYSKLCSVISTIQKDIKDTAGEHKKDREKDHQVMAEIFRELREHKAEISEIRGTCEEARKHCPGLKR